MQLSATILLYFTSSKIAQVNFLSKITSHSRNIFNPHFSGFFPTFFFHQVSYNAQMIRSYSLILRVAARHGIVVSGRQNPLSLVESPFLIHPVENGTSIEKRKNKFFALSKINFVFHFFF